MVTPGRIVLLNGVSSAGKTTLATAFRDQRSAVGELWVLIGIDDVLSKLPLEWVDLGLTTGPGPFAAEGMSFATGPGGPTVRVGPTCRRLLELYHRTVATAARLGLDVIVDDVVVDDGLLRDWLEVLAGLDPVWVAVRCSREIAEQRERARGDRPIGMAGAQHATVHRDVPYAFEIDTGVLSPAAALSEFIRQLGDADPRRGQSCRDAI
jgi:chloramphenicol 3-O phosphotransferase